MAGGRIYTQQDIDYAVSLAVSAERNRSMRLADELRNEATAARSELSLHPADLRGFYVKSLKLGTRAEAHEWAADKVQELAYPEVPVDEVLANLATLPRVTCWNGGPHKLYKRMTGRKTQERCVDCNLKKEELMGHE